MVNADVRARCLYRHWAIRLRYCEEALSNNLKVLYLHYDLRVNESMVSVCIVGISTLMLYLKYISYTIVHTVLNIGHNPR